MNIFLSATLILQPLLPHVVDIAIGYFLFWNVPIYWS